MCAEKDAEELTVGDAVREWQVAKDKGEVRFGWVYFPKLVNMFMSSFEVEMVA